MLKNTLTLTIALVLCGGVKAAEPDLELCQAFAKARKLYVLKFASNTDQIPTSNGGSISFEQAVQAAWPEKEVITIKSDAYEDLDDVKDLFHTTLSLFIRSYVDLGSGSDAGSSTDIMVIQQGKPGLNPKKTVYALNLNLKNIVRTNTGERIGWVVNSMKQMVSVPFKGRHERYCFRSTDLRELLRDGTIYIDKNEMAERLWDPAELKKVYAHSAKVVDTAEWQKALVDKEEGTIMLEVIGIGTPVSLAAYEATSGRLIFTSNPWNRVGKYALGPGIFDKMLKE